MATTPSYAAARWRLKAAHEKTMRATVDAYMQTRRELEAKYAADLSALKAAYAHNKGAKLGRPIVPRPDPEAVRGLWKAGRTADEMATELRTTKPVVYQVLASLPEYHRVWALLKQGLDYREISERTTLPYAAIHAVKLSVRKRGHDLSRGE